MAGEMRRSKEGLIQKHRSLLHASDDVVLFTQGGCGVFALALHDVFGYPIHIIPGHGGEGIAHLFGWLSAEEPYAIDVMGATPVAARACLGIRRRSMVSRGCRICVGDV